MNQDRKTPAATVVLNYLVQFFVVFLGFFLALFLFRQFENVANEELEATYLINLQKDLTKDNNQLNRRAQDYDDKITNTYFLLEKVLEEGLDPVDSIFYFYRKGLQYNYPYNP